MTAVEYLEEKLKGDNIFSLDVIITKAKEMEKQQIIEAHGDKQKTKSNPGSIVTYGYTYTGEMYYNEKFK